MTRRERAKWEACARRDAAWFYGMGGRRTGGAFGKEARVGEALRAIPAFHRGALSLWHTPRSWPADVRKEFGVATSMVVRLDCTKYPSVGVSTEALEATAVARLSALIAAGSCDDEETLARLATRAKQHYLLAIRALAKARASQASRIHEAPRSGVVLAEEADAEESA